MVLLADFVCKAVERRHQAYVLELARMQLMREGVKVRGYFLCILQHFQDSQSFLEIRLRELFPELSEADTEKRQALAKIVVEFPGDACALFLLSVDEAPA